MLKPVGLKTDFNSFNAFQNRYNSKSIECDTMPPQKLIDSVIHEFEEWCKTYHVDSSKYKFIEPCFIEDDWRQFDFLDAKKAVTITVSDIVYRESDCVIFQRIFGIE